MVKRFEVWNIELNPTKGSEINKIRQCLVVSPNEINKFLNTVVIVPMTSTIKPYPTRLDCHFKAKNGQLVVDQIRSIDKSRLIEKLGTMDVNTCKNVSALIIETFKYQ
ncbi:MAG: type II toxin-antitoxin system PemK/MazF family toxin [Bacteroidia bacterium]|nr:type II toxin-antitoxin system PemK/MazF family toxin [Bacteroidia bacterium]